MKIAYIVTHGKRNNGADPSMTPEGIAAVAQLRSKLPAKPSAVICGTGRRQRQVAEALGLIPTRYSAIVGGPEALDSIKHFGEDMIVLSDGVMIPNSMDTTETDMSASMERLVLGLPNDAVICSGRVSVIALGLTLEQSKSGAVYRVRHNGNQIHLLELVV